MSHTTARNFATRAPSGAVREFDPVTGAIVRASDVGHPDSPVQHPKPPHGRERGRPAVEADLHAAHPGRRLLEPACRPVPAPRR